MKGGGSSARRWVLLLPAAISLFLGLGIWLHLREREPAPAPSSETLEQPTPAEAPALPALPAQAPGEEPPAPADRRPPPPIADGDPHPDAGPPHPHPLTPRHERIFRENQLVGELFGAMDVKDGPGLRRLVNQYQQEFPDDPNQLLEGVRIIADCLEHPGAASTAAGKRYDEQERGSILRRFVERHCLGGP